MKQNFRKPLDDTAVTVTTTATTLASLLTTASSSLHAGTTHILVQNLSLSADIYWAWRSGTPTTANSARLTPGEVEHFWWEATHFSNLKLLVASGTAKLAVIQEAPH